MKKFICRRPNTLFRTKCLFGLCSRSTRCNSLFLQREREEDKRKLEERNKREELVEVLYRLGYQKKFTLRRREEKRIEERRYVKGCQRKASVLLFVYMYVSFGSFRCCSGTKGVGSE